MAYPKLLAEIVLDTALDFAFGLGGAQTVSVPAATYDTILELAAALETVLQVIDATFVVEVSAGGIVTIDCGSGWTEDWTNTDTDLAELLGFDGSEVVTDKVLTASLRHLYGWYAPGGVEYPGRRRRVARRYQPTDAGDAAVWASSSTSTFLELTFDALLETQVEPSAAAVDDDGAGGTVDWTDRTFYDFWVYVAGRRFRFYEDADLGTVAAPGTTGDYLVCVRTDDESEPQQLDPEAYTYFRVVLPVQIVGEAPAPAAPAVESMLRCTGTGATNYLYASQTLSPSQVGNTGSWAVSVRLTGTLTGPGFRYYDGASLIISESLVEGVWSDFTVGPAVIAGDTQLFGLVAGAGDFTGIILDVRWLRLDSGGEVVADAEMDDIGTAEWDVYLGSCTLSKETE